MKALLLLLLACGCTAETPPPEPGPTPASSLSPDAGPPEIPPDTRPPDAPIEPDAGAPDAPDAEVDAEEPTETAWDPDEHSLDGAHCCVGNECACWSNFCGRVEGRVGCCTADCECGATSADGTSCETAP